MKNSTPYIYKKIDHPQDEQYNTSILTPFIISITIHKDLSQSRSFDTSDQKHASFYHEEAKHLTFSLSYHNICLDTTNSTSTYENQSGLTYFVTNAEDAYQKLFGKRKAIARSLLLSEYHYRLFNGQTDYFL